MGLRCWSVSPPLWSRLKYQNYRWIVLKFGNGNIVGLITFLRSVNRRGLSTQPRGALVMSTRVEEVWPQNRSVCVWGSPISSCRVWYWSWTEINKDHCDVMVVIFKVCEDWVEGRAGVCSVCSECKLMKVQAGWDVVLDVLKNQFLKALHQNGGECYRAAGQ